MFFFSFFSFRQLTSPSVQNKLKSKQKAEQQQRAFWRKGGDRLPAVSQPSLRCLCLCLRAILDVRPSRLRICGRAPTAQLKPDRPRLLVSPRRTTCLRRRR